MKKFLSAVLSAAMITSVIILPVHASDGKTEEISYNYYFDIGTGYEKANVHTREMEKLDRGLIAIKSGNSVYLSWRLFDSEDTVYGSADSNVEFNIYRNGSKIATVSDTTNYTDTTAGTSYSVAPVVNGIEGEKCEAVSIYSNSYFDIPVSKPANVTLADGKSYSYTLGDASCGDLDGDGQYEIVVKWDCNPQDNSIDGYTGNVLLDAYKLDGTFLWRIDLGCNIRSGAHYTQFLVYDFDGDGQSEITCQTAPSSKDAAGNYVTAASHVSEISSVSDEINETSYVGTNGKILIGDEYFYIFNGATGEAEDTIYYPNQRVAVKTWGDKDEGYGNRSDRFTADVAYLDGERPYAVYMRGYYMRQSGGNSERQAACAISFDGVQLDCKYSFDTYNVNNYTAKSSSYSYFDDGTYKGVDGYRSGNEKYVGEGNHNCSVADVDDDGKDEVLTGALCYEITEDDILGVKWCTFLEHGDALHIGDYDPTRKGLEFFTIHEDGEGTNTKSGQPVTLDFGMSVIDAENGEIIFHNGANADTGRGMMANVGSGGFYQIIGASTAGNFQSNGGTDFSPISNGMGSNFRIFWDGDLYDELLDGTGITAWDKNIQRMSSIFAASGCTSVNGTKANPSLQADLFGDWREEVVYPTSDNNNLRIFMTTTPTNYKIKTLMHDPVYRSGVAAEQTAYNQPPHVGFYMGEEMFTAEITKIEILSPPSITLYDLGEELNLNGLTAMAYYSDGTSVDISAYTISGYNAYVPGEQTVYVNYLGKSADFKVTVSDISSISITSMPQKTFYYPGNELDTAGLAVAAYYTGISDPVAITNYEISGYDPNVTGQQTVTITYRGKTTTFEVTVAEVERIEITSPPQSTELFVGSVIDKTGLVVTAYYSDGTSAEITDYQLLGYNSAKAGEQTVTVSYFGKTDTFTVTFVESYIEDMNNTYTTTFTTSISNNIPIGSYSGRFIIEHTVTINSMPANGSTNKDTTSGFFMRFNPSNGIGAGWYLSTSSGSNRPGQGSTTSTTANVMWKSTSATQISTTPLTIGETYNFKYEFTHVGDGTGAAVNVTITDSKGAVVGSGTNLNLRNLSNDDQKISPLTVVQIYNQANRNSTSSVTIDNAVIYSQTEIADVEGSDIKLHVISSDDMNLYAVKYDNGTLTNIQSIKLPAQAGTNTVSASFEPDKVFLWNNQMQPLSIWRGTELE